MYKFLLITIIIKITTQYQELKYIIFVRNISFVVTINQKRSVVLERAKDPKCYPAVDQSNWRVSSV